MTLTLVSDNPFTYERDLRPIIEGKVDLPNFRPIDTKLWLSNIAACGHSMEPRWGWAKINGRKEWAQFFLSGAGMAHPPHVYGGNGYVLIYPDKVGEFAICQHEFQMDSDANPERGWRPGRCTKCGIDLSVDSGD